MKATVFVSLGRGNRISKPNIRVGGIAPISSKVRNLLAVLSISRFNSSPSYFVL